MTTPERDLPSLPDLEVSPETFAEIAHLLRQPAYDEVFGKLGVAHAAESGRIVMPPIVLALRRPGAAGHDIATSQPDLGTPGLDLGSPDSVA